MGGICSGPSRFELEFVSEKVADTLNSPRDKEYITMDREEVERIVCDRICNAKLGLAEKRVNFLLYFGGALFGHIRRNSPAVGQQQFSRAS